MFLPVGALTRYLKANARRPGTAIRLRDPPPGWQRESGARRSGLILTRGDWTIQIQGPAPTDDRMRHDRLTIRYDTGIKESPDRWTHRLGHPWGYVRILHGNETIAEGTPFAHGQGILLPLAEQTTVIGLRKTREPVDDDTSNGRAHVTLERSRSRARSIPAYDDVWVEILRIPGKHDVPVRVLDGPVAERRSSQDVARDTVRMRQRRFEGLPEADDEDEVAEGA